MEANNVKALREALVQIVALATQDQPRFAIISTAETALAKPARNCDVGTVEEQRKRFDNFCKKGKLERIAIGAYCAYDCPCGRSFDCKLAWAQMPYKEGGAK